MGPGRTHSLPLLALALFLLAAPPASGGEAYAGDPYSPEFILGFTRHLVSRHEYYRAGMELRRLSAYHPGYIDSGSLHISLQYLLLKGNQFEAVLESGTVQESAVAGCVDGILKADAAFSLSRVPLAAGFLDAGSGDCAGPLSNYRWKRLFVARLLQNDATAAAGLLEEGAIPADIEGDRDKYRTMISWAEKRREAMADPRLALFAGVVPGLGYSIAGNRPTGVMAFIVVSVFSTLTVAAFKTDNAPLGVALGAASTFFYGGSILGGYLEAKRHNGLAAEALRDGLMEDAGLEDDRDRLFEKYGLQRKMP